MENRGVHVNLNKANKNCFAAVGNKSVDMCMFIRRDGNKFYFDIDGREVEVKASWIKNIKMIEEDLAKRSYQPRTEEAKKIQALGLDWNLEQVDKLVELYNRKAEGFDELLLNEAKRNAEGAWIQLQNTLAENR